VKHKKKNPLYASTLLQNRPLSAEQEDILSSSGIVPKMSDMEKILWAGGAAVVAYKIFGQGPSYKQDQSIVKAEEIIRARDVAPASQQELMSYLNQAASMVQQAAQSIAPEIQRVAQTFSAPRGASASQGHAQYPVKKPPVMVSLLEKPKGSGSGKSDITGTNKTQSLPSPGQTVQIAAGLKGLGCCEMGEIQDDVIATGATAVQALQEASGESSAYLQQAVVNPDEIMENTKKMSPLGLALTLYSLNWGYNLLFKRGN